MAVGRRKKEDAKTKLFPIRMTETEIRIVRLKAKQYTGGNVSEWLRFAAINLEPKAKE